MLAINANMYNFIYVCCNITAILIFKWIDIGMVDKTLKVVTIELHSCMIEHAMKSSTFISKIIDNNDTDA